MTRRHCFAFLVLALPPLSIRAESPAPFVPDPASVQRYGEGYRYPQAGWIVVHVEGKPYERGFQQGHLLAEEIAGYVRCFAEEQSTHSPGDGWGLTRTLVNAVFLRRFDPEYLEEMKGIADGAAEAGAKFEGRAIDLTDIVAVNCWAEIDSLPSALEATPSGLETKRFAKPQPRKMPDPTMGRCSSFIATGPATADGKIVFGHITMFGLYPANFFNVWLDVKPEKGHRVVMQSYPGGIQSAMDYYINDAGLMVSETTISQTRFDGKGFALASRIRKALQYASNIDEVADFLTKDNNGLYTNEWLIGDANTNEIAMLQLGTHHNRLSRSSKNEWYGDTPGFYWGCNNTKDLEVRLETIPSVHDRPANVVWRPSERDRAWQKLYREHYGKIDSSFARLAFTSPPLASYHSLDAKYTTSDMAKQLQSYALFGPPLGRTWEASSHERQEYPEIRDLVSNPWTILHADVPHESKAVVSRAVDLADKIGANPKSLGAAGAPTTVPAWHGTILPKTDADIWLASAFAEYERIVATERAFRQEGGDALNAGQRLRLGLERNGFRTSAVDAFGRDGGKFALSEIHASIHDDVWYHRATGKGVLVLNELRRLLTAPVFDAAMESFGEEHAGKMVTSAQFREHLEKAGKRKLGEFFDAWVTGADWIEFELDDVQVANEPKASQPYRVTGVVRRKGPPCDSVAVTIEYDNEEVTQEIKFQGANAKFDIGSHKVPVRVVVDKYLERARVGPAFSVQTFWAEMPETIIVYGTKDEAAGNLDAARQMQQNLRRSSANHTVRIMRDVDVKDPDLKDRHVILIGRPDVNLLTQRFADELPVRFGWRSVRVAGDTLAHSLSAVIAAGANPLGPRHSLVVVAGLSAEATRSAAIRFSEETHQAADVVILPHGTGAAPMLIDAKLTRDLK
jgi:phospholipase B-like protein/peptidase M1-like protein